MYRIPLLLLCFLRDVFEDLLDAAVQDFAEGVERGGRDGLAVLHAVEGVGGDPLLEKELIFRDPFLIERLIEGFVADHIISPEKGYHTLSIDYDLYIEYNDHILPPRGENHSLWKQRRPFVPCFPLSGGPGMRRYFSPSKASK